MTMQRETCTCCYLRYAPERFSPTDKRPQVCTECVHHLSDANKRDREHLRDWRAAYSETAAGYERRLANMHTLLDSADKAQADLRAELSDAIDTISSEFHRAPIGDLRNTLETELVMNERRRAETAFRIRSRAMAVLWRIDQIHNILSGKSAAVCKCGQPENRCEVLAALAPFTEELDKWETQEIDRMKASKTHGLPAQHPDAKKYMQTPGHYWQGPGHYGESSRQPSMFRHRP